MQRKKEKKALYILYSYATVKYFNRITISLMIYLLAILPALMMSKKEFEIISKYLTMCASATFALFIIFVLLKLILSENPNNQPMLEKVVLLWLFITRPIEYSYGYSNQIKLIMVILILLLVNDICIRLSEKYIEIHIERFMPYAKLTPSQHLYEGEYKNYYLKNGIHTFYVANAETITNNNNNEIVNDFDLD